MYEYIDAEESLISCLISDPARIEDVYTMISPEMFESPVLSRSYYEYRKAFDAHRDLSIIGLHQQLATEFPDYEITDAITRCATLGAMGFQIRDYAEVMVKHYKKTCVDAILNRLELKEADVDGQIDGLIKELESLQSGETSKGSTFAELTEQFEDDYFTDKEKDLVFLGEEQVDGLTGGFEGGDIVLVGGRPGCGKSAIAMQWAEVFQSQGKKVAYYNLEMQSRACWERAVAAKSGIEITRIRRAVRFCNDEEELYKKAVDELKQEHGITIYNGSKRVSDIRNDVRNTKPDVVIIDYLQLILCDNRYQGNRAAEVGQISHDLKEVSMTFGIPLICLVQLNRSVDTRRDHKPILSDLRESGDLEQDASIVFFLYNTNEDDRSEKMLSVAKSRQGTLGDIPLVFDGARLHFDLAENVAPFGR